MFLFGFSIALEGNSTSLDLIGEEGGLKTVVGDRASAVSHIGCDTASVLVSSEENVTQWSRVDNDGAGDD